MSKCSRCQKDFSPLIKNNGLPYKTCDRCRYTDDKYRDKHKEQIKKIKEYRESNKEHTKEYGIYYRELNKDMLKEKAKEYRENDKDKINAKRSERITCECGCTSRRDKISQHKKSSCHQKLMEEKNKLKRNLTNLKKSRPLSKKIMTVTISTSSSSKE